MPLYTLAFIVLLTVAYFIHSKRLAPWVADLAIELTQVVCYILIVSHICSISLILGSCERELVLLAKGDRKSIAGAIEAPPFDNS